MERVSIGPLGDTAYLPSGDKTLAYFFYFSSVLSQTRAMIMAVWRSSGKEI